VINALGELKKHVSLSNDRNVCKGALRRMIDSTVRIGNDAMQKHGTQLAVNIANLLMC
jgi:hypothetical protein